MTGWGSSGPRGIEAAQFLQNLEYVSVYEPVILQLPIALLNANPALT